MIPSDGDGVVLRPRGTMMLLPPAEDACQVCARRHDPRQAHDPHSLYWGTAREMQGLPAPTWGDAVADLDGATRAAWTNLLTGWITNVRLLGLTAS